MGLVAHSGAGWTWSKEGTVTAAEVEMETGFGFVAHGEAVMGWWAEMAEERDLEWELRETQVLVAAQAGCGLRVG